MCAINQRIIDDTETETWQQLFSHAKISWANSYNNNTKLQPMSIGKGFYSDQTWDKVAEQTHQNGIHMSTCCKIPT